MCGLVGKFPVVALGYVYVYFDAVIIFGPQGGAAIGYRLRLRHCQPAG